MKTTRSEPPTRKVIALALCASMAMYGCATASKDVATTYVSPLQYQSYDCEQITAEAQRVQLRVQQLGGRLDEASSNDKVMTTVGVVLFWPILFALGGTKQQEAEYGRLKGEYDALQQAAIAKKCPGAVQPAQGTTASANPVAPAAVIPASVTMPSSTSVAPGPLPKTLTDPHGS
jgi:hypothetical protein